MLNFHLSSDFWTLSSDFWTTKKKNIDSSIITGGRLALKFF